MGPEISIMVFTALATDGFNLDLGLKTLCGPRGVETDSATHLLISSTSHLQLCMCLHESERSRVLAQNSNRCLSTHYSLFSLLLN